VTGVSYSYSTIPRISVNYKVGGDIYSSYCDVRVLPSRYVVSSVSSSTPRRRGEGSSYTMPAKVLPSSAWYKTLRWSSSDETVAKVDSKTGRITAVANRRCRDHRHRHQRRHRQVIVTATPARARSVSLNYKTAR
jgi:NADPH-dependent glutamate synthase beta subunit-like oxidoreductase